MHSKKMQSVEKVEIEALIEIDNAGIGSASRTQFILFRGTWLPFRKISKLFASRAEQPKNDNNFPDISII
jgi:hypothetical protein